MSTPVDEIECAERAATKLSPIERDVLVLSAGHGLRNAEIGTRLGITEYQAERILVRALRKFDRALEKQSRPRRRWWWFR